MVNDLDKKMFFLFHEHVFKNTISNDNNKWIIKKQEEEIDNNDNN